MRAAGGSERGCTHCKLRLVGRIKKCRASDAIRPQRGLLPARKAGRVGVQLAAGEVRTGGLRYELVAKGSGGALRCARQAVLRSIAQVIGIHVSTGDIDCLERVIVRYVEENGVARAALDDALDALGLWAVHATSCTLLRIVCVLHTWGAPVSEVLVQRLVLSWATEGTATKSHPISGAA